MSVVIAILLMLAATTAVHMGLPQAIALILSKVLTCHKCLSFWFVLAGLLYAGCQPKYAVLLSILMAYLSNWFAIVLILLNRLYTRLWEKVNKKE